MSDADLLCGDCLVEVAHSTAPDGAARVRCPSCGQEDTVHNALAEAADHGVHEALGGRFAGIKQTGAVRVQKTTEAERRFRFISGI